MSYEHMNIPGPLTTDEVMWLSYQLSQITMPNGKKPFVVSVGGHGRHEIHLANEVGTAVLAFRQTPVWQEEKLSDQPES